MVYERNGQRWIFFHDLFGRWQWTLLDHRGTPLQQARQGFRTYCDCVSDAVRSGFKAGEPVQ